MMIRLLLILFISYKMELTSVRKYFFFERLGQAP